MLLKVDTQGHQLNVIRGGAAFLRQTVVVIAEVSVAELFSGSYSFAEFIAAMEEKGFYVPDILHLRCHRDNTDTQLADIAFVNCAKLV